MPLPSIGIAIKKYIALINQTGTANPTATILLNTIGTITWTRAATGIYHGSFTTTQIKEKIIIPPFGDYNNGTWLKMYTAGHYTLYTEDETKVTLTCFGATPGTPIELSTFNSSIYVEINIYQ